MRAPVEGDIRRSAGTDTMNNDSANATPGKAPGPFRRLLEAIRRSGRPAGMPYADQPFRRLYGRRQS